MFKAFELSVGDLVPDFHGTVVSLSHGFGRTKVTVSDWTNGRESTVSVNHDQTLTVWE